MKIEFYKFHGAGNDFVMIDNCNHHFIPRHETIEFLCDRHFGIGADGLITLQNSSEHDFEMHYYNSDGNESTMCGNGGRCIVSFARMKGIVKNKAVFKAIDGIHEGFILQSSTVEDIVKLKMVNVEKINQEQQFTILNTGSPHCVIFSDDPNTMDVFAEGRRIRNLPRFSPEGINVNFIRIDQNKVHIRTFERGVENETLACGTGAVAVAIAANFSNPEIVSPVMVVARGGELKVHFEKHDGNYFNIWLEGPARFVFKGEIEV